MTVGMVVRTLRQERRMTLATLAMKSGVDQATLSRMETGKMTGRVDSHQRIAQAFGLRLADLYARLDDAGTAREPVSLHAVPSRTATPYTPGTAQWHVLTTQVLQKKMLPALVTLEPRAHTATDAFPAGTERFLYVLAGEVTVKVGPERYVVHTDHTIYFDAHQPHQITNTGKRPARCLSVLTPPVV